MKTLQKNDGLIRENKTLFRSVAPHIFELTVTYVHSFPQLFFDER